MSQEMGVVNGFKTRNNGRVETVRLNNQELEVEIVDTNGTRAVSTYIETSTVRDDTKIELSVILHEGVTKCKVYRFHNNSEKHYWSSCYKLDKLPKVYSEYIPYLIYAYNKNFNTYLEAPEEDNAEYSIRIMDKGIKKTLSIQQNDMGTFLVCRSEKIKDKGKKVISEMYKLSTVPSKYKVPLCYLLKLNRVDLKPSNFSKIK